MGPSALSIAERSSKPMRHPAAARKPDFGHPHFSIPLPPQPRNTAMSLMAPYSSSTTIRRSQIRCAPLSNPKLPRPPPYASAAEFLTTTCPARPLLDHRPADAGMDGLAAAKRRSDRKGSLPSFSSPASATFPNCRDGDKSGAVRTSSWKQRSTTLFSSNSNMRFRLPRSPEKKDESSEFSARLRQLSPRELAGGCVTVSASIPTRRLRTPKNFASTVDIHRGNLMRKAHLQDLPAISSLRSCVRHRTH